MRAPYKVLFICSGNCCRSQMAEALLRHIDKDRFEARSAGAVPAGFVHPLVLETLARNNISTEGLYSKSWDVFVGVPNDIIITLCDEAANVPCPTWPGHPATAHWSTYDPSFHPGADRDRLEAAEKVFQQLKQQIEQLVALPLDNIKPEELKTKVQGLART